MTYKTGVITSEEQVPPGYARIGEITTDKTGQNRLFDAHKDGLLPAVKVMRTTTDRNGPVWVDRSAAERILAASGRPVAANKRHVPVETAFMLSEIDDKIERLARAAERIASAIEAASSGGEVVKCWDDDGEKQEFSCQ